MRHLLRISIGNPRPGRCQRDLIERSGEPVRITGELDTGCIGQKFALPRHRRFDQTGEKQANVADDEQRHAHGDHGQNNAAGIAAPDTGRVSHQKCADRAQEHDAFQNAQHAHVEPHVAVQDMTELVPDHALQLIAAQGFQGAAGDRDDRA